jgi:hypothetical protein
LGGGSSASNSIRQRLISVLKVSICASRTSIGADWMTSNRRCSSWTSPVRAYSRRRACPAGAPSSTWPLCPPTERVDGVTVCLEAHRVVPADGWSWPLASRGSPARCMGWHKDGWKIPHVRTSPSTTCGMAHSAMPSHLRVFHHSALSSCGGVMAEVDL